MRYSIANWGLRHAAWGAIAAAGFAVSLAAQAPAAMAGTPGWQISAQAAQGFDSNIFLSLDHPQAAATTQLHASLGREWSGPKWTFTTAYTPEAMAYAGHDRLDYFAQAYRQNWTYNWGPHTQVVWSAGAERYPERGGAPQFGVADVAAVADASQALALDAVLTGADSTLSLSHQYSLRSSWIASAVVGLRAYRPDSGLLDSAPSSTLLPPQRAQARSGGGALTWVHQLSERRSLRVGGMDTELWFTNPNQRLRYANLQASLQQQFGPHASLQVGAGPSWSWVLASTGTAADTTHLPGQGYAANASLASQWNSGTYGLAWQHADQLGLVPGGVTTDLLALQYSRQWGHSWSADGSLGRSRLAAVASGAGGPSRDSLYVAGHLRYRLAADWSLLGDAGFNTQALPVSALASQPLRRTQFGFGIAYRSGGAR